MTLTAAEKKARYRDRRERGSRVLTVEIMDWDAWTDLLRENGWLHGADAPNAVRAATENLIWEECRDYRRQTAEQTLAKIQSPTIGLLLREIEPRSWRLIRRKDAPSYRPRPDTRIEDDETMSPWGQSLPRKNG